MVCVIICSVILGCCLGLVLSFVWVFGYGSVTVSGLVRILLGFRHACVLLAVLIRLCLVFVIGILHLWWGCFSMFGVSAIWL